MPWPSEVPRCGVRRLMAARIGVLVVGGRLHREAAIAEGHHADHHAGRLALHEVRGGGLGRVHAGGLQVVGGHAARDVEGQDDRALDARHADHRLRPGQRHGQDGQPEQEKRRRDVPAPAHPACARPCCLAPGQRCHSAAMHRRRRRHAATAYTSAAASGNHQTAKSITGQINDIGLSLRRCCCRSLAKRTIARTRSSSVESDSASTPACLNDWLRAGLALLGGLLEALAELLVVRVHVQLLAGLGIFHDDRADVGQLDLARVPQADGQHLVAPVEQAQRPLPARRADEIGDDEDQRALLDGVQPGLEQRRQVGERARAKGGCF